MQRALLQSFMPANRALVLKALEKAGRTDLIGSGPDCLIRGSAPARKAEDKPARTGKPSKKDQPRREKTPEKPRKEAKPAKPAKPAAKPAKPAGRNPAPRNKSR